MIFTPLIGALCIRLVRRSVAQTPIRYESHSAPIVIQYSVTGDLGNLNSTWEASENFTATKRRKDNLIIIIMIMIIMMINNIF